MKMRIVHRLVVAAICSAAFCVTETAMGGEDARVASDTPDKMLTVDEIIAAPRPKTVKTALPDDARIYIGSGVYANRGMMKFGGFCFTYWEPEKLNYDEIIDLCAKEGVGNTLQFWQSHENLLDLAKKAKARGLYSTCIYSAATNGLARKITSTLGDFWIGYDFGERYTFSLYTDWNNRGVSLRALVEEYMNRVHKHVGDLHAAGWGNVMATSSNFSLDYEVAAGAEVPCTEEFTASASPNAPCAGLSTDSPSRWRWPVSLSVWAI